MAIEKKKQFIVTIPMQSESSLKVLEYTYDGDDNRKFSSRFPGIPMINFNLEKGDDYSVLIMWTLPDKDAEIGADGLYNSQRNKNFFCEELKAVLASKGIEYDQNRISEFSVPYDESNDKHIQLFKDLCHGYEDDAFLYVDITYGTKVTTTSAYSSIIYAEKAKSCYINEIVYGKYAFESGGNKGRIYNLRSLYNMSFSLYAISMIPGVDIDDILEEFE